MKKIKSFFIQKVKKLINVSSKTDISDKILLGKNLLELNNQKTPSKIEDIEFKIFSQFGDDGIIQYLINKLDIDREYHNFIEFGVENYEESNTKFLLFNNNWSGLIMDSSGENINYINNSNYFWKYDLEAKSCFVNKSNINELINDSKIDKKKIGLLSIDIDGNDYWVWKEINIIDPLIVIVEFNSVFGFSEKISIPYKNDFSRNKAHYSNLFWGASLEALKYLGQQKGYEFFSTNSSGNNAYFIKKNLFTKFNFKLKKNSYQSKFRESRDKEGNKTHTNYKDRLKIIEDLFVENVETNELIKLSALDLKSK
ncbi:hypothetical protein OAM39_03325 [Candidatus Pelagibacter sp.]|jgi:hypothetical protein|nr:hypothetical protein [Candidatus Pelagibacter sp.]